MRILVIDEDQAVVAALAALLEAHGVEVVPLTDLWELIAIIDSHHFDWVVGDDVAIMLFKGLSPATRRSLLAEFPNEWSSEQLKVLGVDLVIEKPLSPAVLRAQLRLLLAD